MLVDLAFHQPHSPFEKSIVGHPKKCICVWGGSPHKKMFFHGGGGARCLHQNDRFLNSLKAGGVGKQTIMLGYRPSPQHRFNMRTNRLQLHTFDLRPRGQIKNNSWVLFFYMFNLIVYSLRW